MTTNDFQPVPQHCGRDMWAVIDRKTSTNALNRESNTPVFWCCECHHKERRAAKIEITADGSRYRVVEANS